MNLHPSPDAPLLLRAGADLLLAAHIGGAALGIVSGWVAILAPKSGRLHRQAGKVFVVAMLVMTSVAAATAPFLKEDQWTNTTAAVFTFYLVASSWMTVARRPGAVGLFERGAAGLAMALAAMGLALAVAYGRGPQAGAYATVYVFAGLAALAAVCDLRMIRAGGLTGVDRLARHLWRMTTALLVATGSYFIGQPRFVPAPIRGTIFAALPVFAVLGLLVFWMIRIRVGRRFRPPAVGSALA